MGLFIAKVSWLSYLSIALMSALKFMVGVGMSMALKLSFWEQFLSTTIGGIVGVWVFTYFGDKIRAWIAQRRGRPAHFTPSEKWARLWAKYGLWGVAFLTPPILSPPIGTAIALAFGSPRHLIGQRMTIAMVVWGLFFASVWQTVRPLLLQVLP